MVGVRKETEQGHTVREERVPSTVPPKIFPRIVRGGFCLSFTNEEAGPPAKGSDLTTGLEPNPNSRQAFHFALGAFLGHALGRSLEGAFLGGVPGGPLRVQGLWAPPPWHHLSRGPGATCSVARGSGLAAPRPRPVVARPCPCSGSSARSLSSCICQHLGVSCSFILTV